MDKIKKEAFLYLGYKNNLPDEKTISEIDKCIDEIKALKSEKYTYSVFDILKNENEIEIKNTNMRLFSKDVLNHLKNSKKVAILCVTLGAQVDFLINKYNKTNLSHAVLFDACATAFVEDVCDRAQEEIGEIAKKEGFKITPRFSAGYGDFPLENQKDIIKITNAEKYINLTVTDECVLIPTKSVTAFIGFTKSETVSCTNKCLACNMKENCKFRRDLI